MHKKIKPGNSIIDEIKDNLVLLYVNSNTLFTFNSITMSFKVIHRI